VEVDGVEDVIFEQGRVIGGVEEGILDAAEGPAVDVELAIKDDRGVENLTQRLSEMTEEAGVIAVDVGVKLEVAQLIEGPDAVELGLDVARIVDQILLVFGREHRKHKFIR
jgi:hypothetical protein